MPASLEAWTDGENDAIVAEYMQMLAADLAGQSYNKAQHNRKLQSLLSRSRGSIEFKHQNVSAVLMGAGFPWISGYKPALNYQGSLEDAVARWFATNPTRISEVILAGEEVQSAHSDLLPVRQAPDLRNSKSPDYQALVRLARRFDPAERDERNRKLGRAGEERAFYHEIATLRSGGRGDLAKKVRWASVEDGDGLGYDIHSFDLAGVDRFIEVKTTNGYERTPFYITKNELAVSEERPDHWKLFRLWNFARGPQAFELCPPLHNHVTLSALSYVASFA